MASMFMMTLLVAVLGQAAPDRGQTGDDVGARLERPAYDPQATTRAINFWKKRAERDGKIALGWSELARAYLARHHQTGSLEDARSAEDAARRALRLHANPGVLIILGRSLLAQHRFPEALEVAERAARADRMANALLCDVLIEFGQLDRARVAFSTYPGTDPLDRIALEARMLEAQGDVEALIDRQRELRDLADRMPQLPAELAAWYHVRLGHTLIDHGRLAEGRAACEAALKIIPGEHAALVGLAEAAAAEGRWAEVLRLAEPAARNAPADFEAVHLIARAHSALGRPAEADQAFARLKAMVESGPRIYDRLYACACADANRDLDTALTCARADLALRGDAGAYQTLALVLDRLGKRDEALAAIGTARSLDPRDPDILKTDREIRARHAGRVGEPSNESPR
ncbi:MAG: tetratricopeptide repeat protein [Isosphaeraceae bacterium]